ncbi:MAG: thioredoxin family protein, partial [Caulobacteraceae bacterium]
MRPFKIALVLTAVLGIAGAALAATPPKTGIASFAELKTPLPYPYDEQADADRDVARALKAARKSHKLLLIDLGGNWCLDCRLLAGTIAQEPLKGWLARRY